MDNYRSVVGDNTASNFGRLTLAPAALGNGALEVGGWSQELNSE